MGRSDVEGSSDRHLGANIISCFLTAGRRNLALARRRQVTHRCSFPSGTHPNRSWFPFFESDGRVSAPVFTAGLTGADHGSPSALASRPGCSEPPPTSLLMHGP